MFRDIRAAVVDEAGGKPSEPTLRHPREIFRFALQAVHSRLWYTHSDRWCRV